MKGTQAQSIMPQALFCGRSQLVCSYKKWAACASEDKEAELLFQVRQDYCISLGEHEIEL